MLNRIKLISKSLISTLLVFAMLVLCVQTQVEAATTPDKLLSLKQARTLAIANSNALEKLDIQIDAKNAALSSAIKSVSVKKKNLSTFRWTPLLKFKFPKSPNLAEANEFEFKAVSIQYEIDKLKHSYTDMKLTEMNAVNSLYVDIYVLIENIKFNEARAFALKTSLEKGRIKQLAGEAAPSAVDDLEKAYQKVSQKVSSDSNKLINAKEKLSKKIGINVQTGYYFENPFVDSEISRTLLEDLTNYTLDRDDVYYDACIEETSKRTELETNYRLMRNHYPKKYMNMISSYVDQALAGTEFKPKPFYNQYKDFVYRVNEKWRGKKRILFFKFPKNWFQGDIDGDRFIEDDPYTLYANVLDYKDARANKIQTEESIRENVKDTFNNYIEVKNSFFALQAQVDDARKDLEDAEIQNMNGDLTFGEFKALSDSFEDLQNSMYEAMQLYTKTLYDFDRLTCGGVSYYLDGTGAERSYVTAEYLDGATYYINAIIQNSQFEIGVNIPASFDIAVTDFEFWVDGAQVGNRTPTTESIRHFAFDLNSINRGFIRLYNGDEFIDDVDIDINTLRGPLPIVKEYVPNETRKEIALYDLIKSEVPNQYALKFTPTCPEQISFFRVKSKNGKYLGRENSYTAIENSFIYLNEIQASITELEFEFYDEDKNLMFTGVPDTVFIKVFEKEETEE